MKHTLTFIAILFSFIAFLLFTGCGEGDFRGFTSGEVKTISGVPISGAEIHIMYPDLQPNHPKNKPRAFISFSIPDSGKTTLDIYRFGTAIFIENIVDSSLSSGNYSFALNDILYTNSVYNYEISAPNLKLSKRMFALRSESELLNNVRPLAKTNNSGAFSIQTSILGIGEIFNSEISSIKVPAKIEFIAIKDGEIIARKTILVSNGLDNEVSLIAN